MPETGSDTAFEELTASFNESPEAVFERLADQFRSEQRYHELFDTRLMQGRFKLGLPTTNNTQLDELEEPLASQVEEVYVAACREVGSLWLAAGRIAEAWMYLRPAGEKKMVAEALETIEPEEEDVEPFVQVALQEQVNPGRGYQVVLEQFGTCNAITMFENESQRLPADQRAKLAGMVVRHLHSELTEALKSEISREEGAQPAESSVAELVADRDWLFLEDAYHIDTSHLSMTTRFARWVRDPEILRLAVDLTEYGRRLSSQFQYESEEPFKDLYPSHALFFRAQYGEQVDEAIEFFRQRAAENPAHSVGSLPAETLVALLSRLGRNEEAFEAAVELIPTDMPLIGFAPTMMELAEAAGKFDQMQQICRDRGDRLGYVASLLQGRTGE